MNCISVKLLFPLLEINDLLLINNMYVKNPVEQKKYGPFLQNCFFIYISQALINCGLIANKKRYTNNYY